ncbi:MAG: LLM class flavin-dependent oxidoreductase [Acidobacteria bacterium]|nr:MAG: LLM class flavin-dependent oxidoreductase [Acidobacteriota bacterium]REK11326.1 MAG: LLM class flavin-dependent oxidoreductase [Acidobacteriota bacterium]
MTARMPALSLAAVPGRRIATLELAREIERRGFSGIYCPSFGDGLALCLSLAHATETIPFGTSITPIYTRLPVDFAQNVAYLHEVSGGRFRFGVGVSHAPVHRRLGIEPGRPLEDTRRFCADLRSSPVSELPPLTLAALRDGMTRLAGEIADGVVWANAARCHMRHSLSQLGGRDAEKGFFVGNMIPTVIADDVAAARAVHRKTLSGYVALPNYRNYWREAGFGEEMDRAERALERSNQDEVRAAMSDRWLNECTLSGPAPFVREQVEAWMDAGVKTPILVPSSARGNQMTAFEEVFAAFE